MLALSKKQTIQLAEVLSQLNKFNEKRYQNITSALANAIAGAKSDIERDSFVALLQLASASWIAADAINQSSVQINEKVEE